MNFNNHQQRIIPLNVKSLRTRFALRFLRALRTIHLQEKTHHVQSGSNNFIATNKKYHKVKIAADASLASAVGPRRAWSRAMLSRIRRRRVVARREVVATWRRRSRTESSGQAQELRSLVPGGEDMDMQSLLDETAHYIKCLTTQVKVMRNIVNYCSTN